MKRFFIVCIGLLTVLVMMGANAMAADTVVVLETNQGDIELTLMPDIAPKTVENFTTHVKNGYYDGIIFTVLLKILWFSVETRPEQVVVVNRSGVRHLKMK